MTTVEVTGYVVVDADILSDKANPRSRAVLASQIN
jgi:hypothetical protein